MKSLGNKKSLAPLREQSTNQSIVLSGSFHLEANSKAGEHNELEKTVEDLKTLLNSEEQSKNQHEHEIERLLEENHSLKKDQE